MKIADDIKRQIPNADLPEPDPTNPDKWHRFPCPFCGRERAAINYGVGMFRCFHDRCRVTIGPERRPADSALIARFEFQIIQAMRNFRRKFSGVVRRHNDDVWQFARMLVVEYDRAGKIDDWEADHSGDQNQIDRYMLRELTCDLFDWGKAFVRRLRAEEQQTPESVGWGYSVIGPVEDGVIDRLTWAGRWRRWPYLELRFRQGRTVREIAEIKGVSTRTADRMLAEEMSDARQTLTEKSLTPVNYPTCGDEKSPKFLRNP